LFTLYL